MSNMDTGNDKPLPEKSSSFTARESDDNNADNQPPQQQHPQDVHPQDPPKESENEAKTLKHVEPDEPPVANPDHPDPPPPAGEDAEKELQASEVNEQSDDTMQATTEEPIPLPPDLDKVSQNIDQYISSLSSSSSLNSSSAAEAAPEDETPKPQEDVPIFVEQFAILVDAKMDEYDSRDKPMKWCRLTEEGSAAFLEAVDRVSKLYKSLREYSSDYKYAYSINRIGSVLQRAMAYMEDEIRSLLEDYKISDSDATHDSSFSKPTTNSSSATTSNVDQQHQDHNGGGEEPPPPPASENDPPPPDNNAAGDSPGIGMGYSYETLSSLSKLSKAMIQGGYETECCQVYFIARRNALEETLHTFGFEKHSIDDVQKMNWESLEREIQAWISTFKQCLATKLHRERKLSDSVFSHHPSISEALFCSLSRGVIVQLVNFLEAVAMTKRAPEKLFKLMDVYETLRDALPMLDGLITSESVEEIKSEAMLTWRRLGEVIIGIFCELENSIKADTGKTPVPGGAVHPLTRYTINYVKYACEYKDTLEQLFREHQKIERADSGAGSDFDCSAASAQQKLAQSPFQVQLGKMMELLDANLEAKSKLYRDLSLSSVFLMNNGRYILQKIRGSPEMNNPMVDAWCRKRSSDLRQYHKNYQRETWGKLLNFLINHEGLNVNGKVVKPVLKERFKSFNTLFDEIHRTQSSWVISDEQLQSELRVSISNMVIPAYRAFLARYGQILTPGRQTEKYVKYQPEDIETYVDELFDGNATPTWKRRS